MYAFCLQSNYILNERTQKRMRKSNRENHIFRRILEREVARIMLWLLGNSAENNVTNLYLPRLNPWLWSLFLYCINIARRNFISICWKRSSYFSSNTLRLKRKSAGNFCYGEFKYLISVLSHLYYIRAPLFALCQVDVAVLW